MESGTDTRGEAAPHGWLVAALAIVLFAAALRFWRVTWGLDDGMPFADEATLFRRYTGDFVPLRLESFDRPDRVSAFLYPTLQGYVIGLSTWLSTTLGLVASPWVEQISGLRVGRFVAASESVFVVCLVGLLATRVHSVRAGLFAAALMAVAPMPVMQAHYISTDPLVIFFMTATLWAAYDLLRTGRPRWAFGGGVLVGLAFGTKYSGLIAGVAIAWASLEVAWRERSSSRFVALGLWAVLGLMAGVLAACPLCIWRAGYTWDMLVFYGALTSFDHLMPWRVELAPGLGILGRPYVYQLAVALPFVVGWAIYALAAAGVFTALRRRMAFDRILLAALASYLFAAGLSRSLELRYVLHIAPVLVLLAIRFLVELPSRRLAITLFAVAFLYSSTLTLSQVARFSYGQQWAMAMWLHDRVDDRDGEAVIAVPDTYVGWMGLDVPFRRLRLPLERRPPGEWLRGEPDFVVIPDLLADTVRTRAFPRLRGELERIESGEAGYALAGEWRSGYFTDFLYTSLDPALAGSYTQGSVGFRVFERSG